MVGHRIQSLESALPNHVTIIIGVGRVAGQDGETIGRSLGDDVRKGQAPAFLRICIKLRLSRTVLMVQVR